MRASDHLQVLTWLNLQRIDAANAGAGKGGTTSKVKLRGLPYGATTMAVVNFFKGFGVTESNVQFGVNSVSSSCLNGPHIPGCCVDAFI